MGKIVATYHVKVTVRQIDERTPILQDESATEDVDETPPTIAEVEEAVALAVARLGGFITANATAERTDR